MRILDYNSFFASVLLKKVGIAAGTVSEIIAEYRKNNPDFDLQREYVVNIKKEGQNLDQLGSAIRLANRLDKLHLNPEQIESFLDKIDEHCFKKGTETAVFIKNVADVCSLSSKTRIPVAEMQLREFAMNSPVIEGLQTTERNLAIVTVQRNAAYMEICRLRTRLDFEEYAIALRKLNDTKDDKCRS